MICNRISLTDFRNIESANIELCDSVNIFYGNNAQGKTNLLEAIYFSAVGRSFRASHEADVIRFGSDFSSVSLDYTDSQRRQNISVRIFKDKRKQIEHNKVKITKISDVIGSFRAVLFCPEHLSIIKDGPAERRNFLDMALSQLYPMYLRSLQKYNHILKQRNQLIKSAADDRKTFDLTVDSWSCQLAHEAAIISRYRYLYTKQAEKYLSLCFCEMTGGKEIPSLVYLTSLKGDGIDHTDVESTEKKYLELLTSSHEREIYAQTTLFGIHKDDLDILLNGRSARNFASQGQQRAISVSLKLAEGEIVKDESGEYPVFLFDDVMSELDDRKKNYLVERIKGKQVIITGCDSNFSDSLSAKVIYVENGSYRELK